MERVKRGVGSGWICSNFPVTSLGETNMRPTAMLFRNPVSMDAWRKNSRNALRSGCAFALYEVTDK